MSLEFHLTWNQLVSVVMTESAWTEQLSSPWKHARCLVWDFICPNTIARSHVKQSAHQSGSVSASVEEKKKKYSSLSHTYFFVPIVVETLGPWGPQADSFMSELRRSYVFNTKCGHEIGLGVTLISTSCSVTHYRSIICY